MIGLDGAVGMQVPGQITTASAAKGKERKERKERKSIDIAPFCTKVHTKRSGMEHTVLPANNSKGEQAKKKQLF